MKEKTKNFLNKSFKRKLIIYIFFIAFLPIFLITSLLLIKTRTEMKNQAILNLEKDLKFTSMEIDMLVYNIKSVSDKFSYDLEIEKYLQEDYANKKTKKNFDINTLKGYFKKTNLLNDDYAIAAIYTKNNQILNFLDSFNDGEDIEKRILEMGATEKDKTSVFSWYNFDENFFKKDSKEEVIIGMRRILNPLTGIWKYTQFFSIPEKDIENIYNKVFLELESDIYILNEENKIISTNLDIKEEMNPQLKKILELEQEKFSYKNNEYIIKTTNLTNADWKMISVTDTKVLTKAIDALYIYIVMAMITLVFISFLIINIIVKKFLNPIDAINDSMKKVYNENLDAYINEENLYGELKIMVQYYNSMLEKINNFIIYRMKMEKQKKELELDVLMSQVNPHFLYNTLETIVWKSAAVGQPELGRLAASLGRMYRLSISDKKVIIKFTAEIEHLMAYINIQEARYKKRVNFNIFIDFDEIREYSIIKMTLQPIVENCFMHAIENIDYTLNIDIKVKILKNKINIYIIDDGIGIEKEKLEAIRKSLEENKLLEENKKSKGTGIGLNNINQRILLYFGQKNGVKIYSKKEKGTIILLTIPKNMYKDKN